ncbi:unnamed protein product [Ilex paraguariensis]|uniref:Uncharacterized protein n=1 Tax=Ilex paraguariensis TaxID=185542 RepID=A0ABC8TNR8_9AQUA
MDRQSPYADSRINPYTAAQMQKLAGERMQQKAALNNLPGRSNSFPAEQGDPYVTARTGGQWQWDRDVPNVSNPMSSQPYTAGKYCSSTFK